MAGAAASSEPDGQRPYYSDHFLCAVRSFYPKAHPAMTHACCLLYLAGQVFRARRPLCDCLESIVPICRDNRPIARFTRAEIYSEFRPPVSRVLRVHTTLHQTVHLKRQKTIHK